MDPAFLRPGRFDKVVNVPLPDLDSRKKLFNYYMKRVKLGWGVKSSPLASRTTGMSGADIKNIVNQAVIRAVKYGRATSQEDFDYAIDQMVMGIYRSSNFMDEKDKLLTAYHEGGHTLMNLLTDSGMDLHKVTILPAGNSLGHTGFIQKHDSFEYTSKNLKAFLDVVRFFL